MHRFGAQLTWNLSRERGDRHDLSVDLRIERAHQAGKPAENQFGARFMSRW